MQHRGELVEKAVRESGFPIAELARRMKKSRRHIYNLFENPYLSLDEILQIGKIIHYDFSELFTDMSKSKNIVEESVRLMVIRLFIGKISILRCWRSIMRCWSGFRGEAPANLFRLNTK